MPFGSGRQETDMRTIMMASALVAGLVAPAIAEASGTRCAAAPDGRPIAASEVIKGLEDLGYRVDRIKTEGGCYEVRAVNDSGLPIKAIYTRSTGELVQARLR
jgi:hypothetical protein